MLGFPVPASALPQGCQSETAKRLIRGDWSALRTAVRVSDWAFQPAIFIGLGRCETCDGPLSVFGEVHGRAHDGIIYLGGIFSIEIEKAAAVDMLETAIERDLMSNDTNYARGVELCRALGSTKDFDGLASIRQQMHAAMKVGSRGLKQLSSGNLVGAEADLSEALRVFEELGDREWQARTLINLGLLHNERRSPEQAEHSYSKALALLEQLDNRSELAEVHGLLGGVFEARDERERARRAYQEALELFRELGDADGVRTIEADLRRLTT